MADPTGRKVRELPSALESPSQPAVRPLESATESRAEASARETRQLRTELDRVRFERDRAVATLQAFGATRGTLDPLDVRGLAHDLRNLLQAVIGQSLRVSTLLGQEHAAQEHLRMIERAAEAAADLTERMTQPCDPARPGCCDANGVLGELLDLLLPVAPKGVAFERSFDASLPPLAIGDDELRQIALNLVVNAWQAVSERGGRVRVVTQRARDRGVVEVSDDGGGIDESVLERIFEPFFSTRAAGRGLGLATVQLLLRRAGGDVRVSSRPEGGTSFVVGLPLASEAGS